MTDLIKFPHTPHLMWLGKASPREDKVLSAQEAARFIKARVVTEEKVDGANIGFSLNPEGEIRVQNRGSYLGRSSHPQFSPLWAWVAERQSVLKKSLARGIILFGEWCFARHSILYNQLPDWFLAFDVFDIKQHEFWSVKRRDQLISSLGLSAVPKLGQGVFTRKDILKFPDCSRLADGPMEGIYLRTENDSVLTDRAKVVRAEFTQNIGEHWSKKSVQKNALKSA